MSFKPALNLSRCKCSLWTRNFCRPCYVIMGGVKKDEGAVLTIGPNSTMFDRWDLKDALPRDNGTTPFYVLETNYDHWKEPPFFDDRRYPAEDCLDKAGSKGVNWETLYNTLHGKPNRNRLTTYTTLMDSTTGGFVAYKEYCTDIDCSQYRCSTRSTAPILTAVPGDCSSNAM